MPAGRPAAREQPATANHLWRLSWPAAEWRPSTSTSASTSARLWPARQWQPVGPAGELLQARHLADCPARVEQAPDQECKLSPLLLFSSSSLSLSLSVCSCFVFPPRPCLYLGALCAAPKQRARPANRRKPPPTRPKLPLFRLVAGATSALSDAPPARRGASCVASCAQHEHLEHPLEPPASQKEHTSTGRWATGGLSCGAARGHLEAPPFGPPFGLPSGRLLGLQRRPLADVRAWPRSLSTSQPRGPPARQQEARGHNSSRRATFGMLSRAAFGMLLACFWAALSEPKEQRGARSCSN